MKGVLRRTFGGERRFNILTVENSNNCSDAPVCIVIDSRKINVIGSEGGDRLLVHFDPVCK